MSVTVHNPGESVADWEQALRYIKEGNGRFSKNQCIPRDNTGLSADVSAVFKNGQKPFAAVITCADSRVAPEIYLDLRLGDIFVIRNAGNIADSTVLGNVEYAVGHLKTPLVLVIGHSKCGAVTGAIGNDEFGGNLAGVIGVIREAVGGCGELSEAVKANVAKSVDVIKKNPVVIEKSAKVIGAYYDIETGIVTYLDE